MFKELEEKGLVVTKTQDGNFKRLTATKDNIPFMSMQIASDDEATVFINECLDKLNQTGSYINKPKPPRNLSA